MSFEATYVKSNKTELALIKEYWFMASALFTTPYQPAISYTTSELLFPEGVPPMSTFHKKGTQDGHLQHKQPNREKVGYMVATPQVEHGAKG